MHVKLRLLAWASHLCLLTCSISAYKLAQTWLARGPGFMSALAFFHSAVTWDRQQGLGGRREKECEVKWRGITSVYLPGKLSVRLCYLTTAPLYATLAAICVHKHKASTSVSAYLLVVTCCAQCRDTLWRTEQPAEALQQQLHTADALSLGRPFKDGTKHIRSAILHL